MQQQQGGSQYGVPPPELLNPPFFTLGAGSRQQQRHVGIHAGVDHLQQPAAEAASPISSRSAPPASIFDDFGGAGGVVMRGISDEEALCGGEEGDRGASGGGNRWPRQETLVLLKVRSEMDSAFRDATVKGPLWEDVSRKLAELGYMRSAKKCKEKFENVHKYYKRTKEGRAGRQDGKSYRFFSQLEALHTPAAVGAAAISSFALPPPNTILVTPQIMEASGPGSTSLPPPPASRSEPPPAQLVALQPSVPDLAATFAAAAGVSFSSNTSSSSSSDSDTDDGCAGVLREGRRKRKRESWPGSGGKTMAFFERLMKELMERQEVMQQRFLDTIEKREQDRMIREEAWKRQEMARLNREYELMAQERAMAANRDAAVISFLQKFTAGGHGDRPPPANAPESSSPEEAPRQAAQQPDNQRIIHQSDEIAPQQPPQSVEPDSSAAAAAAEMPEVIAGGCGLDVVSPPPLSTSRWPKAEVLALIKLRSGLDTRYMDSGPKGPLWEEISQAMKRLGYSRSTKRCKEKWENINKYFKKVKEGNKKRPEDAKTCPYYHELDALYRKKLQQEIAAASIPNPPVSRPPQQEIGNKNPAAVRSNFGNGGNFEGGGRGIQLPRSNGAEISQVFFGGSLGSGSGAALKRPEDIIKELMEQQQHRDEDEYDEDEEDDEEEEEDDGNQRYEIQFQRQNAGAASGGPRAGPTEKAPPPSASNAGSFLAMVQ